jgi:hypothetical protein
VQPLLVDTIAAVLAAAALTVVWLIARRWWISRTRLTFELSVSLRAGRGSAGPSGRGWALGVGRYDQDRLEWFRVFSFSLRPEQTFDRTYLRVLGSREPQGSEAFALFSGHVVVECDTRDGPMQLAMSPQSLTAMMAWLEAAPPGRGASQAG